MFSMSRKPPQPSIMAMAMAITIRHHSPQDEHEETSVHVDKMNTIRILYYYTLLAAIIYNMSKV